MPGLPELPQKFGLIGIALDPFDTGDQEPDSDQPAAQVRGDDVLEALGDLERECVKLA